MTIPNPLPACLSHLAQRDRAVRERALEEAAFECEAHGAVALSHDGTWSKTVDWGDRCAATIRALKEKTDD